MWVFAGAFVFGLALSFTTALQMVAVNVPTDVVYMLPFAIIMLALVVFARRAYLPVALGTSYRRDAR